MPATEQTWRDQKKMHVIFAISAFIMGVATIWMMAADQMREWKDWQLKDRRKDAWMLASRRDSLAAQYSGEMSAYNADIRRLDSRGVDPDLISQFKQRVAVELVDKPEDAPTEDAATVDVQGDPRFAALDRRVKELDEAAAKAAEARTAAEAAEASAPMDASAGADGSDASPAAATGSTPGASAARAAATSAEDAAIAARKDLFEEMNRFILEARRREDALAAKKKSVNGQRTAIVSELGIAIGEGASEQRTTEVQGHIDELDGELDELTTQIADAKSYRLDLEAFVAQANAEKIVLSKQLDAMQTELDRLNEQVYKNTSNFGEWMTRWPVLNALYSGNIRVDQIWLPDMTINYNFAQAARFDRCTTCHRAISTTAPGTATDPLYPSLPEEERELTVQLATPAESIDVPADDEARIQKVVELYGLALSETGIINDADVTVHYVLPESAAAKAGLQAGDHLRSIGGEPMHDPVAARMALLRRVKPESTVAIEVHRGLDHPFTAHPRLDLYLSDLSPHPQKEVGCTICHDGQGSGTSFPWTSHTPNDAKQQDDWATNHGWFDNHHWIFPMKPARFTESNCLKCHHQKGALQASEKFPEPPAPKLVEGWTLVQDFGCFGCHEINGYDSPTVTVGPDVRLEPTYHEAAAQILNDPELTEDERAYATALMESPEDAESRDMLYASIKRDEALADGADEGSARLTAETHKVAAVLKAAEMPGEMRKVGPSLRFLNAKVEYDWLYSWIRLPQDFRPTTKMPQFFGQYEHLDEDPEELKDSLRFEPIEIRALAEYLLKASNEFQYIEPETGVAEASAERGKWLFESRGCLACHSHAEFPGIAAHQGPELSNMGAKLTTEKGRQWLYTWLKQPNKYHARTVMPDLYLDPIPQKNAQGQPTGEVTDPAADIAAFLLGVESEWEPRNVPERGQLSDQEKADLEDLAVLWLKSDTIPAGRARTYLQKGIPESQASKLKADEKLLVNWSNDPYNEQTRTERQLDFVARRTISKYGCFGCHDIPGFEDAKPIGTALVDWGRKETSKLAFENIHKFLETHGIDPQGPTSEQLAAARQAETTEEPATGAAAGTSHQGTMHAKHLNPADFKSDASYFIQALNSHGRDGFLWQKLRHPRSYDYKTTRNKNFNERLRMPRFPFNDQQREAVMTFVLGLVKEPPASKYLYTPDPRQQALDEGREVLERFNCAGCHTLRMEQWQFSYHDDTFEAPAENVDYPFLAPQFTDAQVAASKAKDYRGFLHATLQGEPVTDVETGEQGWVDEDRAPITPAELAEIEAEEGETVPVFYRFNVWQDALLNGEPYLRGGGELLIPANREGYGPADGAAYPAWGGDLARYLFPKVIAHARESGSQANANEAWGWLPPPLMDEGAKVQTDWLHGFLMDPTLIRPAVVLRMPNFHMSSDEAAKLVDYFAAASNVEFPYEYKPQQRASYLAKASEQQENPLAEAMNIVVDQQYCVKCHAVGDFAPQGDPYTFGPNLAEVYRRLRPKYTRNWIANPVRILPYTGMPKNIPYHPTDVAQDGISEALFPGNSVAQLTGLVDLLMNFDVYAKGQTAVTPLVSAAAAAARPAEGAGGAAPGETPPEEAAEQGAAADPAARGGAAPGEDPAEPETDETAERGAGANDGA